MIRNALTTAETAAGYAGAAGTIATSLVFMPSALTVAASLRAGQLVTEMALTRARRSRSRAEQ